MACGRAAAPGVARSLRFEGGPSNKESRSADLLHAEDPVGTN
jgi:hypothetical protein